MAQYRNPKLADRLRRLCQDERGSYYEIEMGGERLLLLDVADLDAFGEHHWGVIVLRKKWVYVSRSPHALLHREIVGAVKGQLVDHRDNDGLNNRRHNLRVCSDGENKSSRHRGPPSRTGVRGVYPTQYGGYYAILSHRRKLRHLGTFATVEEAKAAYDKAAIEARGEFVVLDFQQAPL